MEEKLKKAKEILIDYKQEHLLSFFDELENEKKEFLLDQILRIDFKEILDLYEKSFEDEEIDMKDISPAPYIIKQNLLEEEKNYYKNIGLDIIKNNEFAVVTLAGGQGSRLRSLWSKRYF
jgi:UDP-N-acetylglucosamine pyrophosphorylase